MNVVNIHERRLDAAPGRVGALIDSLASDEDALWPHRLWPRVKFDRPLGAGAAGGHGPIRYFVEEYEPGRSIRFRFTGPKGFDGYYGYEVVATEGSPVVLRNDLRMTTRGRAVLSWALVFRPMHDALIEDSFSEAQASLGLAPQMRPWSPWVRCLRWVLSGGKARGQTAPRVR